MARVVPDDVPIDALDVSLESVMRGAGADSSAATRPDRRRDRC